MGFLSRLMKPGNEDEDEDVQDEIDAEQAGLLMAQPAEAGEGGGETPATTADAGTPTEEGEAVNPPPPSGDPAAEADSDPLAMDSPPPTAGQGEQSDQPGPELGGEAPPEASSKDALDAFRVAATRDAYVPILKEALEDVSVAELLEEARSIRRSLLGE